MTESHLEYPSGSPIDLPSALHLARSPAYIERGCHGDSNAEPTFLVLSGSSTVRFEASTVPRLLSSNRSQSNERCWYVNCCVSLSGKSRVAPERVLALHLDAALRLAMSPSSSSVYHSVGLPEIDAEHRALLRLAEQLYNDIDTGVAKDTLPSVLASLAAYAGFHFENEETLMRQTGFPEYEQHCQEHATFVSTVSQLKALCRSESADIAGLTEFLRSWIEQHMCGADHRMVDHVRRNHNMLGGAVHQELVETTGGHLERPDDSRPIVRMSKRAEEVLRCIAHDMSNKEIAHALGISLKTVDFHRNQLKRRLKVNGTAGMVRYAIRVGIVQP